MEQFQKRGYNGNPPSRFQISDFALGVSLTQQFQKVVHQGTIAIEKHIRTLRRAHELDVGCYNGVTIAF